MIFTFGTGGGADPKELYEALKYSGLPITEDMSYEEMLEVLKDFYPEIPIGTSYDFVYKGSVEEWEVPLTAVYKLEAWGGKGGSYGGNVGGNGGYSCGYVLLKAKQKISICCGGGILSQKQGNTVSYGGYNGGGTSSGSYWGHGGGGATHIAKVNRGVLSNYSANQSEVLLVGAGGGGADGGGRGGDGGGLTGNSGSYGTGGTQTAGGSGGATGSFGIGANGSGAGAGGAGWYGGGSGKNQGGGGGGSSYIGGTPELEYKGNTYIPVTLSGQNSGHGKAKITLIAI